MAQLNKALLSLENAYRQRASNVSFGALPFSFSSLLIRIAAADTPMKTENIGSATREMINAGAAMVGRECEDGMEQPMPMILGDGRSLCVGWVADSAGCSEGGS